MRSNLFKMTGTALLLALILIAGFVPAIGYIPIGPIKMTWIVVPVVIGTLAFGLRSGLILGAAFAITSLIQVWYPGDWLGLQLMSISAFKMLLIIFIPRLLIPVVTHFINKMLESKLEIYVEIGLFAVFTIVALLNISTNWYFFILAGLVLVTMVFFRRNDKIKTRYAMAAVFGSLTNTVLFLGGIYVLFLREPAFAAVAEQIGTSVATLGAFLTTVALTNGIPEAILAFVLTGVLMSVFAASGYVYANDKKDKAEKEEA